MKACSTGPTASSCTATAAAGTWSMPHLDAGRCPGQEGCRHRLHSLRRRSAQGPSGERFLDWIGGYFEPHWSVNPHWTAKFEKFPDHPISRGVKPFEINDEWYYHMRFREGMKGVTPILTALPPKESLSRPDGPHSGNPAVRAAVLERKEPQHMAWAAEREGGGRGFGFTGGHDHWNWGDPNFRKLVLNAIVWCAHGEVPARRRRVAAAVTLEGARSEPGPEDKPANFDREAMRKKLKLPPDDASEKPSRGDSSRSASDRASKPVFASKRRHAADARPRGRDRCRHHRREAAVAGRHSTAATVSAATGPTGPSRGWSGSSGEKKLTELKWKSAKPGWGKVHVNKNCRRRAAQDQREGGRVRHRHARQQRDRSSICRRTAATRGSRPAAASTTAAPGKAAARRCSSLVYVKQPPARATLAAGGGNDSPERDAAKAVAESRRGRGPGSDALCQRAEISNITNIDIDHLGRVWVCEVKNYRGSSGSCRTPRPEGDRILVLEDTDGDGKCDKQTVFYQGRDIDSAHGICVLGNRVIVSASDKVLVFYDENGDLKADDKRKCCSAASAARSTTTASTPSSSAPTASSISTSATRASSSRTRTASRSSIRPATRSTASRKPYQEGMVFRCNLDGSERRDARLELPQQLGSGRRFVRHALAERQRRRRQQGRAHQLRHGVRQLRLQGRDDRRRLEDAAREHGEGDSAAALAPERSGRRAEAAAHRGGLADRHLRL